ncbi:hypothetical protein D9M69_699160 [compost metagenome]
MIASAGPGTLVRCGKQGIDFLASQELHQGAGKALAGDSKHPLDLSGMSRRLERRVTKEGMNCGEAKISTANAHALTLLQVIEKCNDQRSIDFLEIHA